MARVVATQLGYYGSKRRDVGEEFGLSDRAHLSKAWMQPVDWTPGEVDPLDHDGDGKKGGSLPKAAPAQKAAATVTPDPIRASTETTVTPPVTALKKVDPITGSDI